jgi:hypothetical protein
LYGIWKDLEGGKINKNLGMARRKKKTTAVLGGI